MVSIADSPKTGHSYLTVLSEAAEATSLSPNQLLLPLTARVSEADHLEIGGCDIPLLVAQFGSPLYVLDEATLRAACRQYRSAMAQYYPGDSLVLYASKAWNCLAVCAIAHSEHIGIDVASGGELFTAVRAGVNAEGLYMHGNNKTAAELRLAVDTGCRIVVDNWYELDLLSRLAKAGMRPVPVLLRLTPGIECHTHEYIRTGHLDSKFGFAAGQVEAVFQHIRQQPQLQCLGLHAHIGSQIFELQPHIDLPAVLVPWMKRAAALGLPMTELNVGGGLGIRYTESDDPPSIEAWVKAVAQAVVSACKVEQMPLPRLICEPGRSLIGSAGLTAYSVGSQKTIPGVRTYAAIDGGMSDNPRPITYQSKHQVLLANQMSAPLTEQITLAGKHCESGDVLLYDAYLPRLSAHDIVTVLGTGAYNYSMASNYNRIPKPAAVLVKDGEAQVIIERETLQDLIRQDRLPVNLLSNSLAETL